MAYQVTARKWRPQEFDEVVYQGHVSKTISNSIVQDRISHAYLFAGPRGVGKTTMARILAKALNCQSADKPTDKPCGKCENCVEIKNGNSFDVYEIDGASNRGIDNIRELRENVNLSPVKSRYKVYIIDEVHMLTKEAFNALLKTLEEPPDHVVFIFATTEIHRIPETILSRCQKYRFKKISVDAIVSHLGKIVAAEGYAIDKNALYPIARAAEGSMRDSQSLLDQVISFSDGKIKEADALSILGIVSLDSYVNILNKISSFDKAGLMDEVERMAELGTDVHRYVWGFIDIIRTVRLICSGVELNEILGYSAEEASSLRSAGEKYTDEELSLIYKIASGLENNLRFSSNERISLEMALLDMANAKHAPSLSSIIKKLSEANPESSSVDPGKKATAPEKKTGSLSGHKPESKTEHNEKNDDSSGDPSGSPSGDPALETIKSLFHGEVIE